MMPPAGAINSELLEMWRIDMHVMPKIRVIRELLRVMMSSSAEKVLSLLI